MTIAMSKKLLRERRRREIADLIHREGTISSEELADAFNVSLMTIWRDLKALEDKEMIQRVHGGAAALDDATIEPVYTKKQSINRRSKEQIARYTCKAFINAGDMMAVVNTRNPSNDDIIFFASLTSSIRSAVIVQAFCGDGNLDVGEECDDGNTVDGDGKFK